MHRSVVIIALLMGCASDEGAGPTAEERRQIIEQLGEQVCIAQEEEEVCSECQDSCSE